MKILLTSNGLESRAVRDTFVQMLPQPPKALKAVIVTTASVGWKERNKHAVTTHGFFDTLGFAGNDFLDVEIEPAERLYGYDVICLNGGSPLHLLHHLRRSGAGDVLKRLSGGPLSIVGVSAGAVVLGPSVSIVAHFDGGLDTFGVTDWTGLGLIDCAVLPHYNRRSSKPCFMEAFRRFQQAVDYRVMSIADDEALLFDGSTIARIADPSVV